ncbi:1705_t:CDS:2 [Paraglomus brasilianum]|uniref:thioredoxin-dependent peroxiredoxin n=1 Tax=Paraglomus brasilianum TaxID=144538 RepID=A0A9N9B5L4_9GLOM|nr:1705_t:CDS:2 [Paraglomus brasilianum]
MPHNLLNKPAPADIVLQNQNGEEVNLSSFIGSRPTIVFFYPKDETSGCTKEVCSFRDSYNVFSDAGAVVVGISADPISSHKRFSDTNRLNFPLLSDADGVARKAFQVSKSLFGMIAGRVTYLIDREGIIRQVFNSQTDIEGHVKKSLEFVAEQCETE